MYTYPKQICIYVYIHIYTAASVFDWPLENSSFYKDNVIKLCLVGFLYKKVSSYIFFHYNPFSPSMLQRPIPIFSLCLQKHFREATSLSQCYFS